MNYRGIDYDIRVGVDRAIVWVVKTPKPQRGTATSRDVAILLQKGSSMLGAGSVRKPASQRVQR